VLKKVPRHEDVWGSGSMAPLIINFGSRWRWRWPSMEYCQDGVSRKSYS